MTRSIRSLLLATWLAPLAGSLTAQAGTAGGGVSLAPCKVPGLGEEALCGILEVFENRTAAAGRKIGVQFVVLKATGTARAAEAIFKFVGGPGDVASHNIGGFAEDMAELRSTRDLVAVDLRGTGRSASLDCPNIGDSRGTQGFLDDFMPAKEVAECRRQLERDHDLRLYTTPLAMDDVEDVRAALGYDSVDVVGDSYGTRSALVYMRQHPAHVRAALLEGLVPTSARSPLTFAGDAQASLNKVLTACAGESACHAAFSDPVGDLNRALASLETRVAQVELKNPSTGDPVVVRLSRNGFAQALRYMLYSPSTHPLIPLYLHEAARGNVRPFAEIAQSFAGVFGTLTAGYFLSVTCSEDVRFFTLAEAATAARGTFLGDFRARKQKEACAEWAAGELPTGYADLVHSSAPTLLISGERDPVTPATWADEAARTLPHSLRVVVPGGGHGWDGLEGAECVNQLGIEFLRRGTTTGLDDTCVSKIHVRPFVTQLAAEVLVEIPVNELRRLEGTYAEAAFTITVRLSSGGLTIEFPGRSPLRLTPVGPLRFKIEGAPPGFFITFDEKGADVVATLEEGSGATPERLVRKP